MTGEDTALALLRLLAEEDGQSIHRVAKRLQLSLSELQRILTALGPDPHFDGLDLVEQREADGRILLHLTGKGRRLCATC
jgi:DNA-binding IclR family transcriptional regulator